MEKVAKQIGSLIYEELENVFQQISMEHNIDYDMLMTKYAVKFSSIGGKTSEKPVKGKRGRLSRNKAEDYIETEEYEYDGTTYLVDSKTNIVYSHNIEHPRLIGELLIDGSIRFSK